MNAKHSLCAGPKIRHAASGLRGRFGSDFLDFFGLSRVSAGFFLWQDKKNQI
jgi:hypothetical protein